MSTKKMIGGTIVALTFLVGVIVISLMVTKIPNGHVGVKFSPNGGVQEKTLGQGWHLVGIFDKVTKYPVRMQTVVYKDVPVATSDGKTIEIDISFNYNVQPEKVVEVFNTFGPVPVEDIQNNYLSNRLWDSARKTIANYSVIETYGEKSSEAALSIQDFFSKDVSKLGFKIQDLTLGVPKPDESTQKSINKRVEASQELERKQIELEIAKAEAEKLEIEANAQAEYNSIISKSVTAEVLQNKWIEKWDGVMPKATGTEQLIQIPIDK